MINKYIYHGVGTRKSADSTASGMGLTEEGYGFEKYRSEQSAVGIGCGTGI